MMETMVTANANDAQDEIHDLGAAVGRGRMVRPEDRRDAEQGHPSRTPEHRWEEPWMGAIESALTSILREGSKGLIIQSPRSFREFTPSNFGADLS
jgi:hypothetical protein